jgi:hypothetical protein
MDAMREMRQTAPYPQPLADLLAEFSLPGRDWKVTLADVVRDPAEYGRGESSGLTLCILVTAPDTQHPELLTRVMNYFPVPPATWDARGWRRWLLERCRDVDLHELCEAFTIAGEQPYAPSHGPGNDPYIVREIGTAEDAAWRFNQPRPIESGPENHCPNPLAHIEVRGRP